MALLWQQDGSRVVAYSSIAATLLIMFPPTRPLIADLTAAQLLQETGRAGAGGCLPKGQGTEEETETQDDKMANPLHCY